MWKTILSNNYFKWAVLIVVIIIVLLIAKGSIKKFFRKLKQRKADEEILDKVSNRKKPDNLSYPSDTYDRYANKIVQAMDAWINVNESRVKEVFKNLKNNDDFEQLTNSFGRRQGDTLSEWLYWGLNEDEIQEINTNLSKKGIGYQF